MWVTEIDSTMKVINTNPAQESLRSLTQLLLIIMCTVIKLKSCVILVKSIAHEINKVSKDLSRFQHLRTFWCPLG